MNPAPKEIFSFRTECCWQGRPRDTLIEQMQSIEVSRVAGSGAWCENLS